MPGTSLTLPNDDKFSVIFNEALETKDIMNLAYKEKYYKEAIKLAYESMLFIAESIAAKEGIEIRKRDCHLQSSLLLKQFMKKYNITKFELDTLESIRQIRNSFVHPENHYLEIKEKKNYKTIATKAVKAANTMASHKSLTS